MVLVACNKYLYSVMGTTKKCEIIFFNVIYTWLTAVIGGVAFKGGA